jgi:NitT/TauT family transport system substrate-binding protein
MNREGRHMLKFPKVAAIAFVASLVASGADALDRVALGYTNLSQNSLDFVAVELGFFKDEGLQVDLVSTSGTSTLVPTLISGSLQIATVPPPVLIQAANSGLRLVAISGLSEIDPKSNDTALIRKASSDPLLPGNIKGKRLAVSTIGSISQILLDDWLHRRGVEPSTFSYVEVPFSQMQTVLKQGTVDAGLFPEPFLTSTLQSGDGKVETYFLSELPMGVPGMINIADAEWAKAHPDIIVRFRRALDRALTYSTEHPAEVKQIVGKRLKLSDKVMDLTSISGLRATIEPKDMAWWLDLMKSQKLIEQPLDPRALVYP